MAEIKLSWGILAGIYDLALPWFTLICICSYYTSMSFQNSTQQKHKKNKNITPKNRPLDSIRNRPSWQGVRIRKTGPRQTTFLANKPLVAKVFGAPNGRRKYSLRIFRPAKTKCKRRPETFNYIGIWCPEMFHDLMPMICAGVRVFLCNKNEKWNT